MASVLLLEESRNHFKEPKRMTSIASCKSLNSNESLRELVSDCTSLHITDRIEDLTPDLFKGLEHIRQLIIGPNDRELSDAHRGKIVIPPRLFAEMPLLRELQIRHKGITELGPTSFAGLPHLQALVLSGNKISKIDPRAFSGLEKLGAVVMDHNRLTKIRRSDFADLKSLNRLHLDFNLIEHVEPAAFRNNPQLISLKLSQNKILDLICEGLAGLRNLSNLDLSGNPLSSCDWTFLLALGLHTSVKVKNKDKDLCLTKADAITEPWGTLWRNHSWRNKPRAKQPLKSSERLNVSEEETSLIRKCSYLKKHSGSVSLAKSRN